LRHYWTTTAPSAQQSAPYSPFFAVLKSAFSHRAPMTRHTVSKTSVLLAVTTACLVASLWTPTTHALNLKLSGINYDFRRGTDWEVERCKTSAAITREIKLLQTITNRVRVYSLTDCNVRDVLRSATTLNMTVWLGVWVSNRTSVFTRELATLKSLISEKLVTNELVDGINVGSEVLYRNDTTPQVLLENFKAVKNVLTTSGLTIPLSITDTLGELYKHPEVVAVQDIVTFNVFPFWNKVAIDSAVVDLEASIDAMGNMTKAKPFVITETGWPAGGFDKRASEASPTSAAVRTVALAEYLAFVSRIAHLISSFPPHSDT
jgi:glucan 1,3-beta-glucosidase